MNLAIRVLIIAFLICQYHDCERPDDTRSTDMVANGLMSQGARYQPSSYWPSFIGMIIVQHKKDPWSYQSQLIVHWDKMADIFQTTFSSFLEWKILNLIKNFTEICFWGSNWQYGRIGSGNGLVTNMRQAIIWTNVGMLYWYVYQGYPAKRGLPAMLTHGR